MKGGLRVEETQFTAAQYRGITSIPDTKEPEPDDDTEAGAWQEELDFSVLADTSMTLPGQGDPGEHCGNWAMRKVCDNCGEPVPVESRCGKRECPECSNVWATDRAVGVATRLGAARYAADAGIEKRAVHAVISPPEGETRTLNDVYSGFRDAYDLAREKGVRGGVAIFHGYRVLGDVKDEFRAEDPDMGIWKWIIEVRPENWRDLSYWSPHWHVLGLCVDFEANDPDAQDGWVAENIRSLESFKISEMDGFEDMVGVTRYLLSHATFETGSSRDCVRWFGDLATTKFRPEEELSEGALSTIERKAAEAADTVPDDGEGAGEGDDGDECENCGSTSFSSIWEAGSMLMDKGWCERIGAEQEKRLRTAWEWRVGDICPPAGMKNPQTKEQAREAFKAMLEER